MSELEESQEKTVSSPLLSLLVLFRSSVDWMKSPMLERAIFIQSTDLNVNLIQKLPHRNIQNNVNQISGTLWYNQVNTEN